MLLLCILLHLLTVRSSHHRLLRGLLASPWVHRLLPGIVLKLRLWLSILLLLRCRLRHLQILKTLFNRLLRLRLRKERIPVASRECSAC